MRLNVSCQPDENDLELCWDRDPAEWPRDADGRLGFADGSIDLDARAAE